MERQRTIYGYSNDSSHCGGLRAAQRGSGVLMTMNGGWAAWLFGESQRRPLCAQGALFQSASEYSQRAAARPAAQIAVTDQ